MMQAASPRCLHDERNPAASRRRAQVLHPETTIRVADVLFDGARNSGEHKSTVMADAGPAAAAVLPAASVAVPAANEMARVPLPEIEPIVTVRLEVPVPDTLTVPVAVPVALRATFAALSVTVVAPVYVTV